MAKEDLNHFWAQRTDAELLEAMSAIGDYDEEAQETIRQEASRRPGLDLAPLTEAESANAGQPSPSSPSPSGSVGVDPASGSALAPGVIIQGNAGAGGTGRIPGPTEHTRILELVGVILAFCLYPSVRLLLVPKGSPPTVSSLLSSLFYDIGMIALIWSLLARHSTSVVYFPRTPPEWFGELALAFVIFFASYGLGRITREIAILAGLHGGPTSWSRVNWTQGMIALYPVEALFSAAYQEILFRAYLLTQLRESMRGQVALPLLISTALFTMVHGYPPLDSARIFASSIVVTVHS